MSWLSRGLLITLLLAASLLAAGCSHKKTPAKKTSGEKRALTVWNIEEDILSIRNLADRYQAQVGVPVTVEVKSETTIEEELIQALANDQGPDIVLLKSEHLRKHRDKLLPAPETILSRAQVEERFVPAVVSQNIIGGEVSGVTLGLNRLLMFTNSSALNQAQIRYRQRVGEERADENFLRTPAITWAELRDHVREVTQKKGQFITFAGAALGTTSNIPVATDLYAQLIYANGGQLVRADEGAAAFQITDDAGRRPGLGALDFYSSFADPNHKNYTWNDGIGNPLDRFAENRLIYLFGYYDLRLELEKRNRDLVYVTSVPPKRDKLDEHRVVNRSNSLAVTRVAKDPEAAWKFLKFLSEPEQITYYLSFAQEGTGRQSPVKPAETLIPEAERIQYVTVIKGQDPEGFDARLVQMLEAAKSRRTELPAVLQSAADDITRLLQADVVPTPSEVLP